MGTAHETVQTNGRAYRWMDQPLVVVCVDGCEPDYITQAMQAGAAPYLRELCEKGTSLLGEAVEMYQTIGMPRHVEMSEELLKKT